MSYSRGKIPKQATLGDEKHNLGTLETAAIKGSNQQLEDVINTLVADGHIVSASVGATLSSGNMFLTASAVYQDSMVVCVKK